MMGRAGKRSVLLAAIAAFASGCAQLGIPLRNREAESAQAHRRMMLTLADKVETYLVTGDLASAQRAALDYRAERDADPTLLAEWRRRIWTMSESWGGRDGSRQTKREIEGAVDSVDLTKNPPVLSIAGQTFTLDKIKRVVRPGG